MLSSWQSYNVSMHRFVEGSTVVFQGNQFMIIGVFVCLFAAKLVLATFLTIFSRRCVFFVRFQCAFASR